MKPIVLAACLLVSVAPASEVPLGDPGSVEAPPAHAIGFPSRDPALDALPSFRDPPPGYGEVAFYWWLGDPLTRERLTWQLDQLALVDGVMGLQINYAHSDRGGMSYGLTYPSEPALFSSPWWDLLGWFLAEAKKRGMAVSLSDYTLGIGQGWTVDEMLRENPDMNGSVLSHETRDMDGGAECIWPLPEETLMVAGYRLAADRLVPGSGVDLRRHSAGGQLKWRAPASAETDKAGGTGKTSNEDSAGPAEPVRWRVVAVRRNPVVPSIDPMHPRSGLEYARRFFGQFEERNPGEGGRGLNFFFSDELEFRLRGRLWNSRFAAEFLRRKGYDVVPELPALFLDIGARTPKVRLDFSDVQVALTEEGFFKPVFDWHQERGMIYGCDHGGRGRDVVEFGDYFRTQRWNQGPGCDQPGLGSDVVKNKVASSIAHLYQRPRVWLEGYYGSGWGTSSAQLTDATFRNFAMGQNLLTLHGLYYSTHGGWWEWAPPCNHFRMPYWPHLREFFACVKRLGYLLSQGVHRCDVAIVYPVAPVEAGLGGGESVQAAFHLGEFLYGQGIDFDYMDFESLARAKVEEKELRVSGEAYRVLILPAMRAVRFSTIEKVAEFARGGGLAIAFGALPEASDRAGRDDPELGALVKDVFGVTAGDPGREKATGDRQQGEPASEPGKEARSAGGTRRAGVVLQRAEQVAELIGRAFPRDFACVAAPGGRARPQVLHRKVGPRDVYFVYGAPRGAECSFRATGKVELWDPWTGATRPLGVLEQIAECTRLRMPLTEVEAQLIVFSPEAGGAAPRPTPSSEAPAGSVAKLDGDWEFELVPTLDNRFGDFHWPPTSGLVGAEARRLRYADEPEAAASHGQIPGWQSPALDDSTWPRVTCSFGPRFWKLGPLPEKADAAALEANLARLESCDPAAPVEFEGKQYRWEPCSFSMRYGVEGDPGHQGYHGLKELVSDEFIALGKRSDTATSSTYEREAGGSRYYLWTSVAADRATGARASAGGFKPAAVWLKGVRLEKIPARVRLDAGANRLLLRYDAPGRGFFVVDSRDPTGPATDGAAPGGKDSSGRELDGESSDEETFSEGASWIWYPEDEPPSAERFFRRKFLVDRAPAAARLRITCDNGYAVFLNGKEVGRGGRWETVQEFDVKSLLRSGPNIIAVQARNDGGPAGLIAELTLAGPGGEAAFRVITDASWRAARTEETGWRDTAFDDARWVAAQSLSGFEGSLWATHPQGPPRLDEPAPSPAEAVQPRPLAMRWHDDPKILPFDVRPRTARPAGWYRFTSPPGLRGMMVAARGKLQAWADGQELEVARIRARDDGAVEYAVRVGRLARGPAKVALRIEQERGWYGGAALPEPIRLDCGPGSLALGDWSQVDGLSCYSGGAWYRKTFDLTSEQASGALVLDLGSVVSSAEVHINGRLAGVKVAPPWKLDIGSLVRPGANRVEVLVYSTLGNHYTTIPTRYLGSTTAGLLGPVTLHAGARAE